MDDNNKLDNSDKTDGEKIAPDATEQPSSTPKAKVLPLAVFSQTAQQTVQAIINQLRKDNLYNEDVAASVKSTIPRIKKIATDSFQTCTKILTEALVVKGEETKQEIKNKEELIKRKDHFTRFLLSPYEEVICMGDSIEISPQKFPRKIIALFKQAIELMVPPIIIEKSKPLSEEIVSLYPDNDKEGGTDWESISRDFIFVNKAVQENRSKGGPINWEEVHKTWEANIQDENHIAQLKKIGEIKEPNEQIMRRLLEELTNPETMESEQKKLKEKILEHIFQEAGHDPEEVECERICADFIQVLSKGLPENQ